jgi:hypothetical protein
VRTEPEGVLRLARPQRSSRTGCSVRPDAEAVRGGADLAKVVNARRGMYTADGRLYTREAAGKRPRLMPEQIFRDARDRDDAIRLLRLHGYII